MNKEFKNLTEKQDEELFERLSEYRFSIRHEHEKETESDKYKNEADFKTFIAKIRKETAEMVCDKMIGIEVSDEANCQLDYNFRIVEERQKKQQILKEL